MNLDGRFHEANNQTSTVNNFSMIGPHDRGITVEQALAGMVALVTELFFT